jgi:hypothetical protein
VESADREFLLRLIADALALTKPLTGQEFLIILALHPARHAEQIREVRRTLGLAESVA